MTIRTSAILLPALALALGIALFQAPAQATETAMTPADGGQSVNAPIDDPHRWGD